MSVYAEYAYWKRRVKFLKESGAPQNEIDEAEFYLDDADRSVNWEARMDEYYDDDRGE